MIARKVIATLMALLWLIGSSDEAFSAPTKIKWTEEVQLHDGKVIQLKRVEELGSSGFPVMTRGFAKSFEFCYPPMNIYWKSNPGYWPETFDIVGRKAYVKVTIGGCAECELHGFPETNALYFLWIGDGWKKIGYAEYPKGLKLNLLMDSHLDDNGTSDVRGLVRLAKKENRDSGLYSKMTRANASGRNELPAYKNACKECKRIGGQYNISPEVFIPSDRKDCE